MLDWILKLKTVLVSLLRQKNGLCVLQLDVIEQVFGLIKDGEIVKYRYDRETATIVKR